MSEDNKKTKFNFLDEIMTIFSNNKMIFKDLSKPNEHTTMMITKNGIFDGHEKNEQTGEYNPLGTFDLKEMMKGVGDEEEINKKILAFSKEVNFQEPEFEKLDVINLIDSSQLNELIIEDKNSKTLPRDKMPQLENMLKKVLWKDAKNTIDKTAMVFDGGNLYGWVFRAADRCFLVKLSDFFSLMLNLTGLADTNDLNLEKKGSTRK